MLSQLIAGRGTVVVARAADEPSVFICASCERKPSNRIFDHLSQPINRRLKSETAESRQRRFRVEVS